jgi:hypothetical protein
MVEPCCRRGQSTHPQPAATIGRPPLCFYFLILDLNHPAAAGGSPSDSLPGTGGAILSVGRGVCLSFG